MVSQPKNLECKILNSYLLHVLLKIVTKCLVTRADAARDFKPTTSHSCLATDASLTADPGVASSIPARSHTFVEIDHEIISTVILLPSAESFKKGCCQLQAKVCARSTG